MKWLRRKFFRNIGQAKLQFSSLILILALGAFFYTGLSAISSSLGTYVQVYYAKYNLSDAILYFQSVPADAVSSFEELDGVKRVEARQVLEMRRSPSESQAKLLVHTIPKDNQINRNALLEGNFPKRGEVLIDSFFAEANQLRVGDSISLLDQGKELKLFISGLCENVEHSFNIEDPSMVLPDRKTFGVAYLSEDSLENTVYNQLLVDLENEASFTKLMSSIEEIAMNYSYLYLLPKESMKSYQAIKTTVANNKLMSLITPVILFTISSVILFLSLSRIVDAERRQLGILKALGISHRKIFQHYLFYPITTSVIGTALGFCAAAVLFVPMLDEIGHQTYSLPDFHVELSWWSIILPLFLSLFLGSAACYVSTRRTLSSSAMMLMKAKTLKSSNHLFIEKFPKIWQRLSYMSKLMLRNLSMNKLKLFASSMGIVVCVLLLITALGFQASMQQMVQRTKDMYSYDVLVEVEGELSELIQVLPEGNQSPLTKLHLQLSDHQNSHLEFLIVDPPTSHFHHFDQEHKPLELSDEGILLPQSFAEQQGISAGQEIQAKLIGQNGKTQLVQLYVAQLSAQYTSPKAFASKAYLTKKIGPLPNNGISLAFNKGERIDKLQEQLLQRPEVLSVTSREEIDLRIKNLIKQNNPVFSLFILVAVLLSFGAIYTVSSINIQERIGELATLNVLGYSRKELYGLIFKENFLITAIGILLALPWSVLSYSWIVNALSASGQMIPSKLHGLTLLGGVVITLALTIVSNQVLKVPLGRIDRIASLKEVE